MNFAELVQKRCSVRDFSPKPIEKEKLDLILEAAHVAPTAANRQPQRVYVLKSEEAMSKLRGVIRHAYNAPLAMMICYNKNESWKAMEHFGEDYDAGQMDADIVTTMMMMQAEDLGLGTLWVRGYREADVVKAFELPEDTALVCILVMGYPSEDFKRRTARRPLSETVIEL